MAKTTDEILALAEKLGVTVTVSTGPKTTGEIVLRPGIRRPTSSS